MHLHLNELESFLKINGHVHMTLRVNDLDTTTNFAVCMNCVSKGVQRLPIAGLVKATMYKVNNYFVKCSQEIHAQIAAGQMFSEALTKKLDRVTLTHVLIYRAY